MGLSLMPSLWVYASDLAPFPRSLVTLEELGITKLVDLLV
jgi:hypothetical protein